MTPELVYNAKGILAEGPVWDHREGILNWVDIEKGEFNFFDPVSSENHSYNLHSRLGVGIPSNIRGKYIVGLQNGIAIFDKEKPDELNYVGDPESHLSNNRFNDGKCDSEGRLWIGSMDIAFKKGAGSLYMVDSGFNTTSKINNLTISNGMAWDTEQNIMYFIDTPDQVVYAYDYQKEDGTIKNKRIVLTIPKNHGVPDGMTIDEEGMLWIAHWGGFNVTRWDPERARVVEKIMMPVPQPTSCSFGGDKMDTLFITSASKGLTKEMLKDYPASGGIFILKTGVKGKKADFFQF